MFDLTLPGALAVLEILIQKGFEQHLNFSSLPTLQSLAQAEILSAPAPDCLAQNVLWERLRLSCEEAAPYAAMQKERCDSFPAHEFSLLKWMIRADYAQNHKYSTEFNFHG